MHQSNDIPKVKDPFKLIEGMLKRLRGKKTSVQLQYEVRESWTGNRITSTKTKNLAILKIS